MTGTAGMRAAAGLVRVGGSLIALGGAGGSQDLPLAPVQASVPPVLDRVVAPSAQVPRDLGPPPAQSLDQQALVGRDGAVVESRFQVLVVAFPALRGCPGSDQAGYPDPVGRLLVVDERHQLLILVGGPRSSPLLRLCRHLDGRGRV